MKIEGNCSPDPLYRVFGTAALLEEEPDDGFSSFWQGDEQSNRDKYEIYNGVVGLKLRPENGTGLFGLVVKEDELWIDSRREFLGPQKYTVLARVEGKIPNKSEWDLIDALRVLAGILPPEKLSEKREELLDDMFENSPVNSNAADQLVAENFLESLKRGEIGIHNIEQEERKLREAAEEYIEEQDEGAELDVTDFMDRDDFTLSEGYIVDPIAIYW